MGCVEGAPCPRGGELHAGRVTAHRREEKEGAGLERKIGASPRLAVACSGNAASSWLARIEACAGACGAQLTASYICPLALL